jgi:hypothetical protein
MDTIDGARGRSGGARRRATVCGGRHRDGGPPQLSPPPRQAGSSGGHHLHQIGYAVPADNRLLETKRTTGRLQDGHGRERGARRWAQQEDAGDGGILSQKKKNPPKQVVTLGLDFFLTST